MATEKVTQLPGVSAAQLTDIIYAVQGGISSQETLQQVFNLFSTNVTLNYPGNPNGNLAGTVFQLCWDTTDKILYVCTTTGSATAAIWTPCIGQLTNGQLRIGSTGAVPVASTLTAGTNITISNGPGTITISSAGGTGFMWNDVTSGTQALVSNNGYLTNNGAGLVTYSLPATSVFGDLIIINGFSSGGWTIDYGAGQSINVESISTTVTTGTLSSNNDFDCISLRCIVANTTWNAESFVGTLSYT